MIDIPEMKVFIDNYEHCSRIVYQFQEDFSGNWFCTDRQPSEQREPKPNQIDKHPTYRIPQGLVCDASDDAGDRKG